MTLVFRSDERLTPDRVESIRFPAARFGRRGFDEDRVREFRAQVARELVALLNEKTALWEEVERLRHRVLGDDQMPGYHLEDAHVQAVNVLSMAQQTADKYVAEAQEYSRALAEDARRRRDEVMTEARSHAERVLQDAHQRASQAATMVASGNGHGQFADAQVADAQFADGRLADGGHIHGRSADLRAELAYLRTFSDVYRTHLRAYLEALLRNVAEWERAERTSLAAARADQLTPGPLPQ